MADTARSPAVGADLGHLHSKVNPSEASELSFTSVLTTDSEVDMHLPLQNQSSTSDLSPSLGDDHDVPSDSSKGWRSTDTDHHLVGHPLGTIDETSADGFAAYTGASSSSSRDRIRIDSPDYEENLYSPTTYPPTSEEDSEAKRVQQNLERWATEEKMRRKAQRTSKIAASRSPPSAGGGIAKRLSNLRSSGFQTSSSNGLGSGPSSERLADLSTASPVAGNSSARFVPASSISASRTLQRPSSLSSSDSAHSYASFGSEERPNKKLPPIGTRVPVHPTNGSVLADVKEEPINTARNPFHDPPEPEEDSFATSTRRHSQKPTPTATRPIVTVGRASSLQRRALETTYTGKGKGKGRSMPTIVATDTEAEEDLTIRRTRSGLESDAENPFASSQDASTSTTLHQGGLDEEVAMDLAGQQRRSVNGDLGESSMDEGSERRPAPGRTSTSSSKFRELGITDGDDWMDTMGRSNTIKPRKGLRNGRQRGGSNDDIDDEPRKPWWTELLCGCGTSYDDDEQVSTVDGTSRSPPAFVAFLADDHIVTRT